MWYSLMRFPTPPFLLTFSPYLLLFTLARLVCHGGCDKTTASAADLPVRSTFHISEI